MARRSAPPAPLPPVVPAKSQPPAYRSTAGAAIFAKCRRSSSKEPEWSPNKRSANSQPALDMPFVISTSLLAELAWQMGARAGEMARERERDERVEERERERERGRERERERGQGEGAAPR